MKTRQVLYFILGVAGIVLPYSQLIPFFQENGIDLSLFVKQLFANRVSIFFGVDVIVSSLALWVFIYSEGTRLRMRHLWAYVAANLLVGVSFALPLFLLARQSKLDSAVATNKS